MERIWDRLKAFSSLVMLSHTLFCLPFAAIAVLWAADGLPNMWVLGWSFLALVGARNGANGLNRIVDLSFDRKNPRFKQRTLVTGKLTVFQAKVFVFACFALYFLSAAMLGWLCLILSPIPFIIMIFYSYTKRWTFFCHMVLGVACAAAPFGAWLACTQIFDIAPFFLAGSVACWTAGFDILYAIQDIDFDRKNNLQSVPAYFGEKIARVIVFGLHISAVIFLTLLSLDKSIVFLVGIVVFAIILVLENILRGRYIYILNQVVSVTFFCFTLIDWLVRKY